MRCLARMVAKDLLRRRRSPLGIAVVLSFPVVFSLMLAVTFGSGGDEAVRIHVLVENRDDDFAGGMLMSALRSDEVAEHFDVEAVGEEGVRLMEEGKASALLRIPEGFSRDLVEGDPTSLSLVRNPAQGIKPEIAEQLASILVEVLNSGSRVLREPLREIAALEGGDGGIAISDEALTSIVLAIKHTLEGADTYLFPPAITLDSGALEAEQGDDSGGGPGARAIFLIILPGVSVYALFLVGDLAMRDVLTEAAGGTLRRQLAGPIGTGTLILAKALYTICLALVSLAILSAIGWALSEGEVDLAGFAVLSLALVLAVTGVAATLYGAARNERRGSAIAGVLYLFLAFAGGSFVKLESLPRSVRAVAPLSPFYWGTSGYRALLEQGAGLTDVLPNAGLLAGVGVVSLALGSALLGRFVRGGRAA
ncbi:MAG: ABC transporter permease [Acidobacteriota bacterium]